MKRFISLFYFLTLCTTIVLAIPAKRIPKTIQQPDGTELEIVLTGDEFHHFYTTTDGYRIEKNAQGVYEYATLKNNRLQLSGVKALNPNMRSTEHLNLLGSINKNELSEFATQQKVVQKNIRQSMIMQKTEAITSTRMPVILVSYSDVAMIVQNPNTAFDHLLNQENYAENGATGSVKDYYVNASFGQYIPQFDVYGPYTLPHTREYYGGNDLRGDDLRVPEMVADACALANNDIDFSQYDTNDDGNIDQVLIYFAGHNEAEYGPEESVWPHRWVVYPGLNYEGTEADITFDGKTLLDYACFSELKGDQGTNMCGIGTFCHEFGHILGLPDMYATDYSTHHTLGAWDLMDYGPYNNEGRTPPAMSAYERFYLGWLTPTILNSTGNYELNDLQSSNQAYIITSTGEHNLNGENPNPSSFYLLENRQQTSWDTYLPGHGMLVTKVNYNARSWEDNTVNNTSSNMGVKIVQADGQSSAEGDSGDTYPNGTLYTSFTPYTDYPISNISENNGIISFSLSENTSQGGGETNCFTEDFSSCTQSGNTDIGEQLDNFCDNNGWTGSGIFEENGGLKLASQSVGGLLTTPALGFNGNITIEALLEPFRNSVTVSLSLTGNGTLNTTEWDVSAQDVYSCTISGADATTKLSLSVSSRKRFYIYSFEACGETVSTISNPHQSIPLHLIALENGIRIENVHQPYNVRIFNVTGQLYWQNMITGPTDCVLPQGIYLMTISDEAGQYMYTQKFICQ